MPNKRAKDTTVRSIAMPDQLWHRAEAYGAETGTSAGYVIREAMERHLPHDEQDQRENAEPVPA